MVCQSKCFGFLKEKMCVRTHKFDINQKNIVFIKNLACMKAI